MTIKKIYYVGIRVLVVVIYAALLVKIFGVFKTDQNDNLQETHEKPSNIASEVYKKKAYQLDIKNDNPFLESTKQAKKVVENIDQVKTKRKLAKSKTTLWPSIAYYGFVKSNDSKNKRVVVKINSKIYKKREHDKVSDILILKAYKDSLKVKFNNEIKTFRRFYEN